MGYFFVGILEVLQDSCRVGVYYRVGLLLVWVEVYDLEFFCCYGWVLMGFFLIFFCRFLDSVIIDVIYVIVFCFILGGVVFQ